MADVAEKPWTFQDALNCYETARWLRDDLPDGQWEELRGIKDEFAAKFGNNTSTWSEETKAAFTQEIRENDLAW